MKKIAFLRSIEIDQTIPHLQLLEENLTSLGLEARLFFTDGTCDEASFPGTHEKLPKTATAQTFVDHIKSWGACGAISISIPDENTLRDAEVKSLLGNDNIPMISHDITPAFLFSDKWQTKKTVEEYGLRTSAGFFLDGDLLNKRNITVTSYRHMIVEKCKKLAFPLLVKPLWGCLGDGIRFLQSSKDLEDFLDKPFNGNCIIEECIDGQLCSVEIIGQEDDFVFHPLIWKGWTEPKPSFPFKQVRHSLCWTEANIRFSLITPNLRRMCADLSVCGVLEVEMIYSDGMYYVIEVNPRVSGSTALSIEASGFNTYEALLEMLLGRWAEYSKQKVQEGQSVALQFPYLRQIGGDLGSVATIIRSSVFTIDDQEYANAIVSFKLENLGQALARVRACFHLSDEVLTQLHQLQDGKWHSKTAQNAPEMAL
jgi:D-alanine-D-alanine ligase-like ATP-grasp enzyme